MPRCLECFLRSSPSLNHLRKAVRDQIQGHVKPLRRRRPRGLLRWLLLTLAAVSVHLGLSTRPTASAERWGRLLTPGAGNDRRVGLQLMLSLNDAGGSVGAQTECRSTGRPVAGALVGARRDEAGGGPRAGSRRGSSCRRRS